MRSRVKEKQRKSKEYTDQRKAAKWSKIKEGDLVRVKIPRPVLKGERKYSELMKVIKQKGPGTFQREDNKMWNQKQLAYYHCLYQQSKNKHIE